MISKIVTDRQVQMRICDSIISDTGERIPCIMGQVSEVDVVSQNGYRYKKGFWNKVLSDSVIQEKIATRSMLGTIEHPIDDAAYLDTPYEEASHIVIKAWVKDDGNPWCQFALLNNPHGNAIKALLDLGHHPGVSTRGLGDFGNDDVSQFVCDDGYALLGWDIVRRPNFSKLAMERVSDSLRQMPVFKELQEQYHLRDSVDESYNRASLMKQMTAALVEANRIQQELLKLN